MLSKLLQGAASHIARSSAGGGAGMLAGGARMAARAGGAGGTAAMKGAASYLMGGRGFPRLATRGALAGGYFAGASFVENEILTRPWAQEQSGLARAGMAVGTMGLRVAGYRNLAMGAVGSGYGVRGNQIVRGMMRNRNDPAAWSKGIQQMKGLQKSWRHGPGKWLGHLGRKDSLLSKAAGLGGVGARGLWHFPFRMASGIAHTPASALRFGGSIGAASPLFATAAAGTMGYLMGGPEGAAIGAMAASPLFLKGVRSRVGGGFGRSMLPQHGDMGLGTRALFGKTSKMPVLGGMQRAWSKGFVGTDAQNSAPLFSGFFALGAGAGLLNARSKYARTNAQWQDNGPGINPANFGGGIKMARRGRTARNYGPALGLMLHRNHSRVMP